MYKRRGETGWVLHEQWNGGTKKEVFRDEIELSVGKKGASWGRVGRWFIFFWRGAENVGAILLKTA